MDRDISVTPKVLLSKDKKLSGNICSNKRRASHDLPPEDGLDNFNYTVMAVSLTAPFNNMRTLKFKGQPTNAFFAAVNQMFGGSCELPTTVECAVIKSHR